MRDSLFRLIAIGAACLAVASPAFAQTGQTLSATELRLGLVGQWAGALGYRDYQTDELFELPVTTTITTPGDGATLVRQALFDDGPSKPVWITTVSLDDPIAGTTTSASFRAGRAPELDTEAVRVAVVTDPTHWTLIYTRTGEDDDAPADIRVTETRDGDTLLQVKEVRPVGTDETAWRFRNQTRLTRTGNYCTNSLLPADDQERLSSSSLPQDESVVDEVVVTGLREERSERFVGALTRPARGGSVDGQMARWSEPLCLHIIGDAPSMVIGGTPVSLSRLKEGVLDAVRSVGVPALDFGCRANAVVVVTDSSDGFAAAMVSRFRHRLFDNQGEDIAAFRASDNAVRWWHGTRTGGAARPDVEAGSFSASSAAQGELPNSRIRLGTAQNIVRAMAIVDKQNVQYFDLLALFDYIAFVLIIDLPPEIDLSGLDTILNISKVGSEISGLTAWDRAFISGVYNASPDQRLGQQQREISRFMRRALINEPTSTVMPD